MKLVKDPVSAISHLVGFFLSIIGFYLMVCSAIEHATIYHVVAFSIFGSSLILLYLASTLYHWLPLSDDAVKILRRVDHIMIYLLIAGTYTPICLIPLRGVWGWSLLSFIWVLAIVGMVMKLVWMRAPRWISTTFYLAMGWFIVIVIVPLVRTLPPAGLIWLALGGLCYTIGAVLYGTKWPKIVPQFGFHEIFHLFVLGGSISHFWMMYGYVLHME